MKKILICLFCISTVMLSACNEKNISEESSSSVSSSEVSSDVQKKDENEKLVLQIETLEKKLDDMTDFISVNFDIDPEEINGESSGIFDYKRGIHEIYDDTEVVNAYFSGNSSALTDEKDIYVLKTASDVIAEIIKDDMTEYEKELAVYNWLFKHTRFDSGSLAAIPETEEYSHTPYGVLKSGTAICVGNATTFKLFMDMLKIDCKIIHSTMEGEHAWNMVKIDGDWYHMDVTFDGGNVTPAYNCFNVTDYVKRNEGYGWDEDDFPKADSLKYCYVYNKSTEISDYYDIPKIIAEAIRNKEKNVLIRTNDVSMDNWIYDVISHISSYTSNNELYSSQSIYLDEETVIFNIRLEDEEYAEPQNDGGEEPDYSRLDAAIDKAFY